MDDPSVRVVLYNLAALVFGVAGITQLFANTSLNTDRKKAPWQFIRMIFFFILAAVLAGMGMFTR